VTDQQDRLDLIRSALKGARGLAFDNDEYKLDAELARAIDLLDEVAAGVTAPPAEPRAEGLHLDFCSGGEFCPLDDCMCECHVAATPPQRAALDVEALTAFLRQQVRNDTDSSAWRSAIECIEGRITAEEQG